MSRPTNADLRVGAGFDPLGAGERFHVIVSNPPYVADTEAEALQPEVRIVGDAA